MYVAHVAIWHQFRHLKSDYSQEILNHSRKRKAMKKIMMSIAFVVAVFSVSAVHAQQQDPAARAAAMKQKLKDELKLSDVQADSVVAIQAEFRPKMREIFMDQSMSQDDKRAKLAPISEQQNKRIQAVLGDDLFKKYQDWWQKNRPQRQGGGAGGNQ
jgi:predicted nucleic acid-binding Zn ribbon protein